ncbi:MAG: hypothetical protein K6E98_08525 [Lachnospiraceae bacterium]|nr:hypothetical protein [Lachnospiraceae bacterium]
MVTQQQAEEILKKSLADNLIITEAFDNDEYWLFELGLKAADGKVSPLVGPNIIRIRKEDGYMD